MSATTSTSPRLMTEIEREHHYLMQLPSGYESPLFRGKQPVESDNVPRTEHITSRALPRAIAAPGPLHRSRRRPSKV